MEQDLVRLGLSELQAKVYLYLVENGPKNPKELVEKIDISRTNAYKVLESLELLDLAYKSEDSMKLQYLPADPSSLATLVSQKRNDIIALEKDIAEAMTQLRTKYAKQTKALTITRKTGRQAMTEAYLKQADLRQPIYFYRTRSDIPFMGFGTMDKIRKEQGKRTPCRYGITTDSIESPSSDKIDKTSKLKRTWINQKQYTAPVEWSVSGDNLLIQVFDNKGAVISIEDPQIAKSFKQIWQLSDQAIKKDPNYKLMPIKAKREI